MRGLYPGYFALVMATGIVSRALLADGWPGSSLVLLWVGLLAFGVLTVATAWRLLRYRAEVLVDAADPARSFGFFTFVAGAGVLASRTAADDDPGLALSLFVVTAASWLILGYVIPAVVIVRHGIRPVLAGVNGTWFIWVVGTQSVAVAATSMPVPVIWLAVVCWSVGVMLYLVVTTLVLGALFVASVRPVELVPAYWVFMGATAISVLAGAQILRLSPIPLVAAAAPVVAGVSVMLWAFGTWLIPMLVAAGVWRHGVRRVPLVYEPGWWSIVFPLGMYGVASRELGAVTRVPWLVELGAGEAWVAVSAWVAVFVAMVWSLVTSCVGEVGASGRAGQ